MDIMKITPELLDQILIALSKECSFSATNEGNTSAICKAFDITLEELRFVFGKMQRDGFIADWNDRESVFMFLLSHDVWDLIQRGGYTAHFNVVGKELRLLEAEVKKLDKKIGVEKVAQITGIISNIYSFFPKNLMHF